MEQGELAALSLDELPAADDVVTVVIANVQDWATLMHLRTVAKWVGGIATERMATVGLRCGPHQRDFDESGVMHLLGTAFGRVPWSLEEVAQRVRVFASNGCQSSDPLDAHPFFSRPMQLAKVKFNNPVCYLLDRQPRRVFLTEGVGAWFALDLGRYVRVVPESLTLRHSSQQGRALRSFRLDASSADCEHQPEEHQWKALLEVQHDERLGKEEHSSASWDLPIKEDDDDDEELTRVREAFRFFRVVKTGPDASGDAMYTHLSGIELYGQVSLRGLSA